MNPFGVVRVTAAGHATSIANPLGNAAAAIKSLDQFADSDVVVFAELSLAGYTCGDLFSQQHLLDQVLEALSLVTKHTVGRQQLVIVARRHFPHHPSNCGKIQPLGTNKNRIARPLLRKSHTLKGVALRRERANSSQ